MKTLLLKIALVGLVSVLAFAGEVSVETNSTAVDYPKEWTAEDIALYEALARGDGFDLDETITYCNTGPNLPFNYCLMIKSFKEMLAYGYAKNETRKNIARNEFCSLFLRSGSLEKSLISQTSFIDPDGNWVIIAVPSELKKLETNCAKPLKAKKSTKKG